MEWFTADTHFWHRNILGFCRPQFSSVEEMNDYIVRRWVAHVRPEDTVYHLGDVSFAGAGRTRDVMAQLPGRKVLIRGNHDERRTKMLNRGFDEVHDEIVLVRNGRVIRLRHQPDYDNLDVLTICGHVHQRWTRVGNTINAGVDVWCMTPVSLDSLLAAPAELVELDFH